MNFDPYLTLISDPGLKRLALEVTSDHRFHAAPAALSHHHAYTGGLSVHTKEVIDYGLAIGAQFPAFDYGIFITAAIWHDYAKVVEYTLRHHEEIEDIGGLTTFSSNWTRATTHEATQGHILTGAQWCYHHAVRHCAPADLRDAVIHCILSHHGRKDWGSPIEPATLEALVLHQADLLSAQYGRGKENSHD